MELEHFDKPFIKNAREKGPAGKILELFLLDTLKTTFWMEDLAKGWTQLGPFFSKSGHFFRFSKKGRGGLPPDPTALHPPLAPPPSSAPDKISWKLTVLLVLNYLKMSQYSLNINAKNKTSLETINIFWKINIVSDMFYKITLLNCQSKHTKVIVRWVPSM